MTGMVALALQLAGGTEVDSSASDVDAGLLVSAGRGDQNAFATLVRRHYAPVYRVVWRLMNGHADAEDIAQEAFLRLWNNPSQIRDARALRGWLIRVGSNLAMDRFRRAPMDGIEQAESREDPALDPAGQLNRAQVAKRIETAMARLPDRQRLALTLVQFERMSNAAAAAAMDISVDALESLLSRARRNLKDDLSHDWQDLLAALADER